MHINNEEDAPMLEEGKKSPNIESIKEITEEIYKEVDIFNILLRKQLNTARSRFQDLCSNKKREIECLQSKIELEKEKSSKLKEEKIELNSNIEHESENYRLMESELSEIRNQISKLKINNKNQEEILDSLESKSYALSRKIESEKIKKTAKDAKMANLANNYRKYMGIDITPEKHNILKILFKNISSNKEIKAHALVDFSGEGNVIEISPPVIEVEEAQLCFKKMTNFYKFLKFLRFSFRQEFLKQ